MEKIEILKAYFSSFNLTPDATFLAWRKEALVVAPLYSGVVQVFNTKTETGGYEEGEGLVGRSVYKCTVSVVMCTVCTNFTSAASGRLTPSPCLRTSWPQQSPKRSSKHLKGELFDCALMQSK